MQSESAGDIPLIGNIMTGTEGYAKYDVIGADGRHGMIYIYWNNPWFGATYPIVKTSADDVPADCDESAEAGASTFDEDPGLDFSLVPVAYRHVDGGATITAPADLAAGFAAGPVAGVLSLFGFEGIVKDPEWVLELRDSPPAFIPTRPQTRRLLRDAKPNDWIGDWRAEGINVAISRQSRAQLSATISLSAADTPSVVHFSIGPESVVQIVGIPLGNEAAVALPEHASVALESARRLIGATKLRLDPTVIPTRLQSIASQVSKEKNVVEPLALSRSEQSTEIIGRLLVDSRSTVHIDDFVLSLFGIYEGETRVSKILRLQRMSGRVPDVDVMLPQHYDLR